MGKLVIVDLEEFQSLLESAVSRALKNGGVYHGAGFICPDAQARILAGLAASGRIHATAPDGYPTETAEAL